jgi:RNA polymerase sigma-B factor
VTATDTQISGTSTLPDDVRARTSAAFSRLRSLADGPERAEVRAELVALHLPLVEHLAHRFRNRGEPLDDLVQVGTIGLIKAVDRFDLERGVEFSTSRRPPSSARSSAGSGTRAGRSGCRGGSRSCACPWWWPPAT